MCNDNNIVRLGFEKQSKLTKEQSIVNFFNFSQKLFNDSNENVDNHFTLYGGPMCAMKLTS